MVSAGSGGAPCQAVSTPTATRLDRRLQATLALTLTAVLGGCYLHGFDPQVFEDDDNPPQGDSVLRDAGMDAALGEPPIIEDGGLDAGPDSGMQTIIEDGGLSDAGMLPDSGAPGATQLRIATWNLEIFGPTKAGRPDTVNQMATIIRRYDFVALQELKDINEQAPYVLLGAINAMDGPSYAMVLSVRTGLQADDTSSTDEQYAFLFRTDVLTQLAPAATVFPDDAFDHFQREPHAARFATLDGAFDFTALNFHASPNLALDELEALHETIEWARGFYGDDDIVLLGDLNAACAYASTAELDMLQLRTGPYHWVVPDDADTNVAAGSACAYDRIVLTDEARGTLSPPAGEIPWGVDALFVDTAISDHWPVWAVLGGD